MCPSISVCPSVQIAMSIFHLNLFSLQFPVIGNNYIFWSRKQLQNSKCLSVCPTVYPSVHYQNPSASQNHAYQPNLSLLAIMPISHNANQPPSPPLSASQIHNYQPSCLSAIIPIRPSDLCPTFATFKPFRLVQFGRFFLKASLRDRIGQTIIGIKEFNSNKNEFLLRPVLISNQFPIVLHE